MRAHDIDERVVRDLAARLTPGDGAPLVERTETGGSTPVFRVRRGGTTFFLRLAESAAASLVPEAWVHARLRERGVRVPAVVGFAPFDPGVGRSALLTTEIPARPIGDELAGPARRAVLVAAGRDLAVVHSLPVDGFGWVARDGPPDRPRAEHPTQRAIALDGFAGHLARLGGGPLSAEETRAIERVVADRAVWLDEGVACLAHGDLDASHLFHRGGRFAGIIDFGEIRGADRCYDLGHFALHDGERSPEPLLPDLLAGYRAVASLPLDADRRIDLWALLIGVRALARGLDRPRGPYQRHLIGALRRSLARLRG